MAAVGSRPSIVAAQVLLFGLLVCNCLLQATPAAAARQSKPKSPAPHHPMHPAMSSPQRHTTRRSPPAPTATLPTTRPSPSAKRVSPRKVSSSRASPSRPVISSPRPHHSPKNPSSSPMRSPATTYGRRSPPAPTATLPTTRASPSTKRVPPRKVSSSRAFPSRPVISSPRPHHSPKNPSSSPKRSPATTYAPSPGGKPSCFPGNYNRCKDPRTVGLLKAASSNNNPTNIVAPILLPNDGSVLNINADQAYYLAGDYTQDYLSVAGALYCGPPDGPQVDISLTVRALLVSGAFICGSSATPYAKNVTITLTGAGGMDGTKSIMVAGNISWHGVRRATWTTITAHIGVGDVTFSTKDPVDWQPGESIVVSSTNYNPSNYSEMTVQSVSPSPDGGSIVTTSSPFTNAHWGVLQTFTSPSGSSWTLDERAQVGLLDRNIVVQGDPATSGNDTRVGAQLTVSVGGNAWISNVKFLHMGEQGRLGSYPVHWHLLGDRSGNYIIGSVVTKSWNRCITIHATDNVLVERNICHDHIGHGYFLEDGCETGNKFRYNLGLTSRLPPSKEMGTVDTDTDRLATFWITNPFNHYIGNVAGGSDFAGFWMVTPGRGVNKCQQSDMKPDLNPYTMSLGTYRDNIAHSNRVGFAIDSAICSGDRSPLCGGLYKPPTAVAAPDVISNHTNFKNSHNVRTVWVTVDNRIDFKDCKFSGGSGTLFSGKQILTNCLFVGESANNLTDSVLSVNGRINWGFGLYDGPSGLVNTFFTNFFNPPGQADGASACMAPVGSAFKHWPMFLRNVEFAPHIPIESRAYMQRGNYSMAEFVAQAIIDDGSLAGLGPLLMVPWVNDTAENIPAGGLCTAEFNTGAGCQLNTTWNLYFCPPTQKMGSIRLFHNYPQPDSAVRIIDVTRSDGQALTTDNNLGLRLSHQFNTVLGQGFSYNVSYARYPNSILFGGDGNPQNFQVTLLNVDVGDTIPLTLTGLPTSPSWKWRVWDCNKKAVVVPPTDGNTVSFTLTGYYNGLGGPYPNLKGAQHSVFVCAADCKPC